MAGVFFGGGRAARGGRLASHNGQIAEDGSENQIANILNGISLPENQLLVATSSDY